MNGREGNRRLMLVALVLLLVGFASSVVYWSVSEGPPYLALQEDYRGAIAAAAGSDRDAALVLADEHGKDVQRAARLIETHAHALFLSVFLIVFAMLMAAKPGPGNRRLGWLAIGGVLTYPVGLAVQAVGLLVLGQALSAAGAVLVLLFAGSVVIDLFRRSPPDRPAGSDPPAV
jgi:hypothetical protein